jgi:hypothetical protein
MSKKILKKAIIILSAIVLVANASLSGQVVSCDSILISKTWTDKNGENRLTINGTELCNYEKCCVDGHPSKLEVSLTNNKHSLKVKYKLLFDEYQMKTIFFRENEIWFQELNGINAVFIPFFYCGNYDQDTKISYIILYDNQKYLFHIQYFLDIEGDGCFRLNDDLDKKCKKIASEKFRKMVIEQLQTKYKSINEYGYIFSDDYPNYFDITKQETDSSEIYTLYYHKGDSLQKVYEINTEDGSSIAECNDVSYKEYKCFAVYHNSPDCNQYILFNRKNDAFYITKSCFSGFVPGEYVDFENNTLILHNIEWGRNRKHIILNDSNLYVPYDSNIESITGKIIPFDIMLRLSNFEAHHPFAN